MMLLKVLIEVVDSESKDSYLNFRGTCVTFLDGILFNNFLFFLFCKHKNKLLFFSSPALRGRRRCEPLRRGYIELIYNVGILTRMKRDVYYFFR